MTDKPCRSDAPRYFGRRRLLGASALGAAGWVAGGGGWQLALGNSQRSQIAS